MRTYFRMIVLLMYLLCLLIGAGGTLHSAPDYSPLPESNDPAWDGTLRRIYVPILMYHYVSPLPPDSDVLRADLTVSPPVFRAQMQYLRDRGYTTISLYELNLALLMGAPLPPKPIILTFDDGYADHYTTVFPTLREMGFTATFFVITGTADTNDSNHLSWAQISEMAAAGMSMESHSKTHSDLRGRSYDFLVYELLGSLQSLAAHTGKEPRIFCYPSGRYDENTLGTMRTLPIWLAVTTQHGALHTTDGTLELPRLRVSGDMDVAGLDQLLQSSQQMKTRL